MMNGKPQALVSKFKISYSLLLNLIDIQDCDFVHFSRKSMVKDDLDAELKETYNEINKHHAELERLEVSKTHCRTPSYIVEEYLDLLNKKPNAVNKKRKEIEKRIQQIQEEYKYIELDKETMNKYCGKQHFIQELEKKYQTIEKFLDIKVDTILQLLEQKKFIQKTEESLQLTMKGTIATCLREVPCLIFAQMIEQDSLFELSTLQLISFLSCFTNINVQEDRKDYFPKTEDLLLKKRLEEVKDLYNHYQNTENEYQINTGTDYTLHYDLLHYVEKWCKANSIEECKYVLYVLESEKEIFLGEFVKSLLKITNIACELEKIAELLGNMEFLSKLREIPILCLKYVVTNQSLYI